MKHPPSLKAPCAPVIAGVRGFSLVELLAVIAVIAVLAALLLPALAQARGRTQAIICLNNTKQLIVATHLYAGDNAERLPYNVAMTGSSSRTELNWVNNVMTWDLHPDNTNAAALTKASLGAYVGDSPAVYHCPSDQALSAVQRAAAWPARSRSYSMNAMVGDAGTVSSNGINAHNPGYQQFFKVTRIPQPSAIFVFLDEHPDSINDGHFLNQIPQKTYSISSGHYFANWTELPASYHNGAAAFSYADGHALLHRWQQSSTILPPLPKAANLPRAIAASTAAALTDFNWVMEHASVPKTRED